MTLAFLNETFEHFVNIVNIVSQTVEKIIFKKIKRSGNTKSDFEAAVIRIYNNKNLMIS